MSPQTLVIAALVAIVGAAVQAAGNLLMLASSHPTSVGAIASGGGAAAAVGTIVWVARKVVAGELVPLAVEQIVDDARDEARERREMAETLKRWAVERDALTREMIEAMAGLREYIRSPLTPTMPPRPSPAPPQSRHIPNSADRSDG